MQSDDLTNQPSQPRSRLATRSSLIVELKEQSPERWESFTLVYSPLLRFWIRRKNVSDSAQDDVFQECLLSIATGIAQFEKGAGGGTFRGWLRTITERRVADYFRSQSPHVAASQALLEAVPTPEQKNADELQDEQQALSDVRARALALAKPTTSAKNWQMFWLSVMEGVATAEIAREFGVSTAAVRVNRGRILKRLRDLMVDEFTE